MNHATLTPAAEQDLAELAEYVARVAQRPTASDDLVDEILAKCENYADQPGMGSRHPGIPAPYRIFVHSKYVVVYEPVDDGIIVMRVFHGARDWARLFSSDKG